MVTFAALKYVLTWSTDDTYGSQRIEKNRLKAVDWIYPS